MNNEILTVTITKESYDQLKKHEAAIEKLKKENSYLIVTKIQSKCGFIENVEVVNAGLYKSINLKHYNKVLEDNKRLISENIKLTFSKPTIWQLLKEKISL